MEVGWHQLPWCLLRNYQAQPERPGMSQSLRQGQQEVTSMAKGLAPFDTPPKALAPWDQGAPWCLPCLGPGS